MFLIRRAEERLARDFKAGLLPGPVHLYIGQEATAVGVCAHLSDADWITSTHRGHGHYLAKGGDVGPMFAEVYGRSTGICGGMGGSMHVADFSRGILGANGIVGGGIALAAGAALSAQLRGQHAVAVAFFGDGAASQGVLGEALNLASLWRLPLILVCENNSYSEFSPTQDVTAGAIVDRASPFDVAAVVVDGNSVLDVWRAASDAIGRARGGLGPTLIEARTYRFHGHVEGETAFLRDTYREETEVENQRRGDPVLRWRTHLLGERSAPETAVTALEAEIEALVEDAASRAAQDPWPDPSSLDRLKLSPP
jgi:pyruvate dehydrogenase E1 component alpha subunit